MQAVVLTEFGGVENFEDADWPEKEPDADQVKIRAKAVSVNPTDFKARRGGNQGAVPIILGRDTAGVVESVGANVTEFSPGDEVMAYLPRFGDSGGDGYAEFVCIHQAFVVKKPINATFEQAAALPLVSLTAHEAVIMKARVEPGEAVFVAGGSGGVGTMGLQILTRIGASPIVVTAGSDESARYIEELIAPAPVSVLKYPGLSLDELSRRAVEMNGGRLYPATFDFVGREMKKLCCEVVDYWGRISSIAPEPGAPIDEFFSSQEGPLFTKSASFHGTFLRAPVRGGGPAYYGVYKKALEEIRDRVEAGELKPPPLTDMGVMSAGNIAQAHTLLEEGHVRGKLVLRVGD